MSPVLRAASEAEKRERDLVTWGEWGDRLSTSQYLERELALRAHPWARQAMTTWFLTEGSRVLASCETFRNRSTVGAQAGVTLSVASVFTEPALRGNGHAAALMSKLVERLREEPSAHSSVLFSDVGAPIYEKSGYRAAGVPWDWVLPPAPHQPAVEWLDVAAAPRADSGPDGHLVLHPSAEQLDWHFERSRLYARFLGRSALQHQGARTDYATAWWTANFKSNELAVLWLDAPDAAAARPLLEAAQAQAQHAALARVRVWETISLEGISGATRICRDGELPMVANLGAAVTAWRNVQRALWV